MDGLALGRSGLVLLPPYISHSGVFERTRSRLWERDFTFETVRLDETNIGRPPPSVIADELQLTWDDARTPRTAANTVDAENLPDVIFVENVQCGSESQMLEWMQTLKAWAQRSQQRKAAGLTSPVLFMIVPARRLLSVMPDTDLHLAAYWWWGFPSVLEVRLLHRTVTEADGNHPVARWQEYVLPSLALNDVRLMGELCQNDLVGIDSVRARLSQYAEHLDYELDPEKLNSLRMSVSSFGINGAGHRPPPGLRMMWADGMVVFTPEFGIEMHSAVAALCGDVDVIRHRVWRAESEWLSPLIDRIRLLICRMLTRREGIDWPLRWDEPDSEEDREAVSKDPLAAQWGYLEYLLRKVPELRTYRDWLPIVSVCRSLRNDIAHYRIVSRLDLQYLYRELERRGGLPN